MRETEVIGKAAAAAFFKVSVRQVRNWEKAGMPGRVGRTYDLVKIQLWRDQKQGKVLEDDPRQGFLSPQRGKDFQDERLKRAKADLVEMTVRRQRADLIEISKIIEFIEGRNRVMKQGLLTLERSLPPQLVICQSEREMEAVIHQAVRALLESYCRPAPEELTAHDAW
jgi:phage terminase Nu1 subunit (DNA packaging protein)